MSVGKLQMERFYLQIQFSPLPPWFEFSRILGLWGVEMGYLKDTVWELLPVFLLFLELLLNFIWEVNWIGKRFFQVIIRCLICRLLFPLPVAREKGLRVLNRGLKYSCGPRLMSTLEYLPIRIDWFWACWPTNEFCRTVLGFVWCGTRDGQSTFLLFHCVLKDSPSPLPPGKEKCHKIVGLSVMRDYLNTLIL